MNRPRRSKWKSLYLWHRYTGIVCAILVLVLAVTGVLVQHGNALQLDQRYLRNNWLLNWYGIGPAQITSYRTGKHWVSQAGEFIYIDGVAAADRHGDLHGAADTGFGVAAVADGTLVLLTDHGRLIETQAAGSGLPEPALGIAAGDNGIVLHGAGGDWKPDEEMLRWRPYDGPPPEWSEPADTPTPIVNHVQRHYRTHRIHWERALLDLHSGRIFGRYGWLVMDIAAAGLILLACSGIWVWLQRRRKDKEHANH